MAHFPTPSPSWSPKCCYLQKEKILLKLGVKYWHLSFITPNFSKLCHYLYLISMKFHKLKWKLSFTTRNGVKIDSHLFQVQCSFLRNSFNFVMHYTQTRKHLCPPNYCVSILLFKPTLHSKGQCMIANVCNEEEWWKPMCRCWRPSLTFGREGSIDENWWTSQDSLKMWFCFFCMETFVSIFWYHQILPNSPPMETFGNWQMLYKFTNYGQKQKCHFS